MEGELTEAHNGRIGRKRAQRLQRLLRGLEQRGLVKSRWVKAGKVRERKQYEITAKGRAELAERLRKWRQFAAAIELVLSFRGR